KNYRKKVAEVMTTANLITAPQGTTLQKAERILQQYKIEKLPVTDKSGKLIGLITFRDILKYKSHPNSCKDEFGRLLAGAAVGVTADVLDRVDALVQSGVDVITLDSAHGHSKGILDTLQLVKKNFKKLPVIGGTIATAAGALALADAGAHTLKVGI